MAEHYDVRVHRFQVLGGVDEGLALDNAAGGGGDVESVSTQPLCGNLE